MTYGRRSLISLFQLCACVFALATQPCLAQGKVTRLVVGFPPGGPIDFVCCVLSEQLGRELGHSVLVENKPGANAGIAAEFVAKAAPDGHTPFLTSTGAIAISPALYDKLSYDPAHDRTPVTLVVNTDEVLVASSGSPANTTPEFIANARQRKDGATMASSGIGSVPHLAMELLAGAMHKPSLSWKAASRWPRSKARSSRPTPTSERTTSSKHSGRAPTSS